MFSTSSDSLHIYVILYKKKVLFAQLLNQTDQTDKPRDSNEMDYRLQYYVCGSVALPSACGAALHHSMTHPAKYDPLWQVGDSEIRPFSLLENKQSFFKMKYTLKANGNLNKQPAITFGTLK